MRHPRQGTIFRPMALDPAFVADCPYGPGGLLLDDILPIDRDAGRVVARMPAHAEPPLTRETARPPGAPYRST